MANVLVDDLPSESLKNADNYLVKTAFIFCKKCNETLLSPEQGEKIVQKARQEWMEQGMWHKHANHFRFAQIACPKCKTVNYLCFMVFQYVSDDNSAQYKRFRYKTVQFPSFEDMQEFKMEMGK